ncbi:hypothetical protein M569_08045, partial [Genlisea aurea]
SMESGSAAVVSSEKVQSSSYTYWVREATSDAAPLPVPRKIDPADVGNKKHLGSAWNQAGTWEEKNLNTWSSDRIKELLNSVGSLDFSHGNAQVTEVTRCSGEAFSIFVRNKKRVGYTYELTLKLKGEWDFGGEKKTVKGHLDLSEFSFGELDDLQIEIKLTDEKDLAADEKQQIIGDMKLFLHPLREKLAQFEEELKAR